MPGLARKLLVFAAVDGVILEQRGRPATKIAYKDVHITQVANGGSHTEETERGFEAFGLVGLLTVSKSSFLISIIKRQQVAQINGKPIYVITEVALTPLSSKAEAELSIASTRSLLQKKDGDHGIDEDVSDDDTDLAPLQGDDVEDDHTSLPARSADNIKHRRTTSIAEDVISKKGGYGRFAQKWFSQKGWTADQRRNLGLTNPEIVSAAKHDGPSDEDAKIAAADAPIPTEKDHSMDDATAALLPKLLRTTQILFGSSRSFFFSYDHDLTRSMARRSTSGLDMPLHTQVDPLFWWNRKVMQPFVDAGQDTLIMPLIQGFVGQRSFEMDTDPPKPAGGLDGAGSSSMELVDMSTQPDVQQEIGHSNVDAPTSISGPRTSTERKSLKPFLLTLISRRCVKRAGLRYLRRGVDDEGFTANTVESEQILSDPSWSAGSKTYSFLQIRGSVPVFFSQSPYSFKPIPQLQHSEESNYRAFTRHFKFLTDMYGSVQAVSLVEKHGAEAIVGDRYEKFMAHINESEDSRGKIGFEWFDFHAICKGMKFENVSFLMDILGKKPDLFSQNVEVDGKQVLKQKVVLRTNCMDCLDRSNVVMSACGMRALEVQLKEEGIDMSLQPDQMTQWFNTVWADNGDAISKQYASTAALKGDFTRTKKRDFQGALKDMGLSISRFYSGIVNDYFSQAAIDFLLGNVTSVVFEDFEANLMSSDPAVSMQKMRQQAIETCQRLVIADEHEDHIGGWTLLTPQSSNTLKTLPFEESVLLLTSAALYSCRFDWDMEKVSSFERLDLENIVGLKHGTYITSTLSAAQVDEQRNVGFVIEYKAGADDITRINTRSMSNIQSRSSTDLLGGTSTNTGTSTNPPNILQTLLGGPAVPETRILAFKAPSMKSASADGSEPHLSEIEQVKTICAEIERIVLQIQVAEAGAERKSLVESGDVISLAEAKRSTGLLEQLSHSLKKLVWA